MSNRGHITSGGLGGRRAPQKFLDLIQPHKNFSKLLPVSRHCLILPIRPRPNSCQRPAVCGVTASLSREERRPSLPGRLRQIRREKDYVVFLSAYLSLTDVFREYLTIPPNAVHRQPIVELSGSHSIVEAKPPNGRQKGR